MKVLIVDDHPLYLNGLIDVIRTLVPEAQIIEANTCQLAESLIAKEKIDMALLDLGLPDGSGMTLAKQLRSVNPALSIVVVSAFDDQETISKVLATGVSGFVPKHIPRERMLDAFERILAGEVYSPYDNAEVKAEADAAVKEIPISLQQRLTPRQNEVLKLLIRGLPNKAIAAQLGMAEKTVKTHLSAIFAALQVSNRAEAVARILKQKWLV